MSSPDDGKQITRSVARAMIQNFQKTLYFENNKIKGGFLGRNQVLAVLSQPACAGIRYYHALNSDGQHTIVLVGEDLNGNSLSDGVLSDEGPLCPPWCPHSNALDL